MPTVISTVLFILYYIVSLIGEKIVRESIVPSYQGMWLSSSILLVVGVFLTYKATNDSSMLNVDTYLNFIRKFIGIDKHHILDKKIYLSGKFQIIDLARNDLRSILQSLSHQSSSCRKSISKNISLKNIYNQLVHPQPDDRLNDLIVSYNHFFEKIVMSKWFSIKYIRDRLQEFPILEPPGKFKLPVNRGLRLIVIIVFPVFLTYGILYYISLRRTLLKLDFIEEKSKHLSESLENPSLLIDIDNGL